MFFLDVWELGRGRKRGKAGRKALPSSPHACVGAASSSSFRTPSQPPAPKQKLSRSALIARTKSEPLPVREGGTPATRLKWGPLPAEANRWGNQTPTRYLKAQGPPCRLPRTRGAAPALSPAHSLWEGAVGRAAGWAGSLAWCGGWASHHAAHPRVWGSERRIHVLEQKAQAQASSLLRMLLQDHRT